MKMKKRVKKHIENKDFVKVYLVDYDGTPITNFTGIILDQNEDSLLMIEFLEFHYDGLAVFPKSAIDEIRCSDNEKCFGHILNKEGKLTDALNHIKTIGFQLDTYPNMFSFLENKKLPVIVDCSFNKKEIFQLGPILKTTKKKVWLEYINSWGEYSLKPVKSNYKDISFIRIDSDYVNLFYKYGKRVE